MRTVAYCGAGGAHLLELSAQRVDVLPHARPAQLHTHAHTRTPHASSHQVRVSKRCSSPGMDAAATCPACLPRILHAECMPLRYRR